MSLFDPDFLTQWISHQPEWALFIVFCIAFIESLAVIGLLMPGWLLLVGVGLLIGTGSINFYYASLFCFLGAVIGEYLSYLVGVHYQLKVHQWAIFKRHPDWLSNTEAFFQQYGTASIALGRFVGPVRAFVPLLAGMSGMSKLSFQITNILSALIWAPVYLMPGVILGASIEIESEVRWLLLSNILVVVTSAWFLVSFIRKYYQNYSQNYSQKQAIVIITSLTMIFCLSLGILLKGPLHQQLFNLIELFLKIIN